MKRCLLKQIGRVNSRQTEKVTLNLDCGVPKIQVHLNDRKVNATMRKISGYLVDSETGKRISGFSTRTHQYDFRIENPATVRRQFAHRLGSEFQNKKRVAQNRKKAMNGIINGPLRQAYQSYLEAAGYEISSDQRYSLRFNQKWNARTNRAAITYFERQVLPVLDELLRTEGTILQSDLETLKESLVQKAIVNKKSSGQPLTVQKTVERELASALVVYNEIQREMPELELPELHLQITSQKNKPGREQIKSLPDSVRIKLAALLMYRLPATGPACGLALMLLGGLRTAEACAPRFGDIIVNGDYALCTVTSQIRGRKQDSRLKTDAAYRTVVLPFAFVAFYHKAMAHLQKLGYSDEAIADMPFATDGTILNMPLRPEVLSDYIRQLLILCGCSENFLEDQHRLMRHNPDYDEEGNINRDLSAYVLRRDFATRMSFCCGMLTPTLDYLMGHHRKDSLPRDFESPDAQAEIAAEMERFVFLPEFSKNPAFVPIKTSPKNTAVSVCAQQKIILTAGKSNLKLNLSDYEPNGNIEILLPKEFGIIDLQIHAAKDTPKKRIQRVIFGQKVINYDELIAEVLELDIVELERKKQK